MIEFALITPVVLLFVAAIVTIGLALHERSSLQQAVREGARLAAVGNLADAKKVAAGNAPEWIKENDVRVCYPDGSGKVGNRVQVYLATGATPKPGVAVNLVPTGGIFAAFGATDPKVRMDPRATTRLEKSVPSPTPTCPP